MENAKKAVWSPAGLVIALIVILTPGFISCLLVVFYQNQSFELIFPIWSDEIFNWLQIRGFREVGLGTGNFTLNEVSPLLDFSRFYVHGPVYPIIMSMVSVPLNWGFNTVYFTNILMLSMSVLVYVLLANEKKYQLLYLLAVILCFWGMHLYMASAMRFIYFISLAFLMAALFHREYSDEQKLSAYMLVVLFVLVIIATVSKVTNVILFVPLLLILRKKINLSWLSYGTGLIILSMLLIGISMALYAPFPSRFSNILDTFSDSYFLGISAIQNNLQYNVNKLFSEDQAGIWIVARLQLIVMIFYTLFNIVKRPRNYNGKTIFVFVTSSGTFAGILLFYEIGNWVDYRVFTPIILMNTLLLISEKVNAIVLMVILSNLIIAPQFLDAYNNLHKGKEEKMKIIEARKVFAEEVKDIISYKKGGTGWDNTLLVHKAAINSGVMSGLPAGIGLSWYSDIAYVSGIKSRYVLLPGEQASKQSKKENLHFIKTTSQGHLYINKQ